MKNRRNRLHMLKLARLLWGSASLTGRCLSSEAIRRARRTRSTEERLTMLPGQARTLREPIDIYWNEYQIPYINARSDRDLAVGLGIVHAHLRLAQIEIMRRIALGRTAEVLGPIAVEFDQTIRVVGLARKVDEIEAALPDATRDWLEGFAAGINAVIEQARERPEELVLLDLQPEPMRVRDLLAIGRLAAGDFTWKVWQRLLPLKARDDWHILWERLMEDTPIPVPSFSGSDQELFVRVTAAFARHGSNSFAVSARRAANGGAKIASDPHLGIMLPNLWLIAGMHSPGLHAVGLMIPGLPIIALGRNMHIAWGGTSLHAASSDLFDVTDLPDDEITHRTERIAVRWWPAKTIDVPETRYGPVISDAPLLPFPKGRRYALRWIGHDINDEIGAMLAVAHAQNWRAFHEALGGFAAPAQNMIYADREGRVGQAMAAHLPRRASTPPGDLISERSAIDDWNVIITAHDLPSVFEPPSGYVASANNRPWQMETPVGFFFAPDERISRISQLITDSDPIDKDRLKAIQIDVTTPSAPELRNRMTALLAEDADQDAARTVRSLLLDWDGTHTADSLGALAFEFLIHEFLIALHGRRELGLYLATTDPWSLLAADFQRPDSLRLEIAMVQAAAKVAGRLSRYRCWGDAHRLQLNHYFSVAPLIGKAFRFTDDPIGGGNETVMKTAHGIRGKRHHTHLGSIARHISDMSDPDENWFVLLGGQDGWLGSANFLDQYELWRRGDYIQVPLSLASVKDQFTYKSIITPLIAEKPQRQQSVRQKKDTDIHGRGDRISHLESLSSRRHGQEGDTRKTHFGKGPSVHSGNGGG